MPVVLVRTSAIIAAATLVLLLLWALRPQPGEGAVGVNDSTPGFVFRVAVDTDTTGNPGGSGGLLSGIQSTTPSITVGNTRFIDIVVDEVDPADGMSGFGFNLRFDQAVVTIASKDFTSYMLPGALEILPEPIPNTSGNLRIEPAQLFANVSGEGVLVRLGVKCIANGTSPLDLSAEFDADGVPLIYDVIGTPILVLNAVDGQIVCGTGVTPTPSPTPTPLPGPCGSVPWSVNPGDTDCDGFADTITYPQRASEAFVGTDPNDSCADTTTLNDERGPAFGEPLSPWVTDTNDNGITTLGDVLGVSPFFNSPNPNPNYSARFDWNGDGKVTLSDMLAVSPFFNKICVP